MERKIGEIFEYNGEWYQCIESSNCVECAFNGKSKVVCPPCEELKREDGKEVIFKKFEKVGEPYMLEDKKFQKYRVFKTPYIYNKIDCSWQSFADPYYVSFEIKQINEDMEEKYSELIDIVYEYMDKDMTYKYFKEAINNWVDDYITNKESNKPTLKSFDLEKAKQGEPVCTRDGRKAVFLTTLSNKRFPVVAIVNCGQEENVYQYDINGICDENDDALDLMMLSEKKEGWVNVYNDAPIYDTKESAELGASTVKKRIGTFKISWEE